MAKINFLKTPALRKESDWAQVGRLWPHKTKKDCFVGRFGIKTKDQSGQLQDMFSEISIVPEDAIMIRPNLNQREGKRDAKYQILMLKKAVK